MDLVTIIIFIIIIIIIKSSSTGQVGKIESFVMISQPHEYLLLGTLKKHDSGQPTVDCTLKPILRSGVKHSVIPHKNLRGQETPGKL